MNGSEFNQIVQEQICRCTDILVVKAKEYATDDKLHNFKVAGALQCCEPKNALAGMMAKHTISIYDMCRSTQHFPISQWNEKITDHINYLLLLRAIVEEGSKDLVCRVGGTATDGAKSILID